MTLTKPARTILTRDHLPVRKEGVALREVSWKNAMLGHVGTGLEVDFLAARAFPWSHFGSWYGLWWGSPEPIGAAYRSFVTGQGKNERGFSHDHAIDVTASDVLRNQKKTP